MGRDRAGVKAVTQAGSPLTPLLPPLSARLVSRSQPPRIWVEDERMTTTTTYKGRQLAATDTRFDPVTRSYEATVEVTGPRGYADWFRAISTMPRAAQAEHDALALAHDIIDRM